jgi:hypothetical protein
VVAGAGPRPIWWLGRALLYFVAGFAVGFLLLTELALRTIRAVQVAIVLLAVLGLFGGLRKGLARALGAVDPDRLNQEAPRR